MSRPKRKTLLIVIWGIAISAVLVSFWSDAARGSLSLEALSFLVALYIGAIGSLIFARYPQHPVGWTFLGALCFVTIEAAVEAATWVYTDQLAAISARTAATLDLIEAYRSSVSVGVWFSLLIFPVLYFPNGELPSPRWRYVARAAVPLLVVETLNPQLSATFFPDNQGLISVPVLGTIAELTSSTLVLAAVIAPLSLVLRFRRATGIERQQIKWPLYSAMLATIGIGGIVVLIIASNVFGAGELQRGDQIVQAGLALEALSVMTFPITIGIGILRHRLFDIDLLINRTLVYGTLTALLALTYFGSVVVAQQVLPAESPIAIVLSTLAIVALFSPLRRRIQSLIDKRFYRQRYDARNTLERFSEELREGIDLDEISNALLNVILESIFPEHVSLWLRDGHDRLQGARREGR